MLFDHFCPLKELFAINPGIKAQTRLKAIAVQLPNTVPVKNFDDGLSALSVAIGCARLSVVFCSLSLAQSYGSHETWTCSRLNSSRS